MGLAPLDVVQKLERSLGDAIVFTDNPIADGHWLGGLNVAAGRPMRLIPVCRMNNTFRRSDFSWATGEERAAVWITESGPQRIAREKAPGLRWGHSP
jgi:hypothetical protein